MYRELKQNPKEAHENGVAHKEDPFCNKTNPTIPEKHTEMQILSAMWKYHQMWSRELQSKTFSSV